MDTSQRRHLFRLQQRRAALTAPNDPADRWDWSSTMVVVLVVILALVLGFEIWAPHFGLH